MLSIRHRYAVTTSLLLFASPMALAAQTATDRSSVNQSSQLVRTMAEELRTAAHLPGLSVAVGVEGRVVFAEGFGFADVELKKPVTASTQFRTGSVAKVITATALAKLVQDGRVDLDAPVQRYATAYPVKQWPITTRQLAGHLAGVPHYNAANKIERRFYSSMTDALGVFSAESLLFEPGTKYSYSTHGFTLLSAVIESASGKPFLDYVRDAVLTPLRMSSTGPNLIASPGPQMSNLYAVSNGAAFRIRTPEDPSYKWAGGGFVSTPTDLVRLATGYFGSYLKPKTVTLLTSTQRLKSGSETGVGIAWRNSFDMDGRRVIEHAGSMEGARSGLSIFPDARVAVAIMANSAWSSMVEETAHMMALPFLTKPSPVRELNGMATVTVTLVKANGEKESKSGELTLHGGKGRLTIEGNTPTSQSFALVYMQRGHTYAMVRPDGIVHLDLRVEGTNVTGKAIGYGSPRLTPPAGNPPFLSFEGTFSPAK